MKSLKDCSGKKLFLLKFHACDLTLTRTPHTQVTLEGKFTYLPPDRSRTSVSTHSHRLGGRASREAAARRGTCTHTHTHTHMGSSRSVGSSMTCIAHAGLWQPPGPPCRPRHTGAKVRINAHAGPHLAREVLLAQLLAARASRAGRLNCARFLLIYMESTSVSQQLGSRFHIAACRSKIK